jgi:hypothetical protein
MLTYALALLLSAGPPASRAQQLSQRGAWEELYLAYATASPEGYSAPERKAVGEALLKGCQRLLEEDAVMAYSLAEGAARFAGSAPAQLCLARAALATEQRGSAESALLEGHRRFPQEGALALALGRLLLEDQQPLRAAEVLARVGKGAREHTEAQRLLTQARRKGAEEQSAWRQAEALERRMSGEPPPSSGRVSPALAREDTSHGGSLSYTSGVGPGGVRVRANSRFVIKYFNNERDFGQRAEYEGKVVQALDEAYTTTRRILGQVRQAPVDVVLYTVEEFTLHQGAQAARMVAGLYSQGAIRINDAAELTRQTRATLVHEYVHAAVDELAGGRGGAVPTWLNEGLAEYVEWRYLGSDEPPHAIKTALRGEARAQRLPRLEDMERGPLLVQRNPTLAYATSAVAVRQLVQREGADSVVALVRDVAGGTTFAEALSHHFGLSVEALEAEVQDALLRR